MGSHAPAVWAARHRGQSSPSKTEAVTMCSLVISTNLRKDTIPDNFCTEATKLLADVLDIAPKYILVQVCPDQMMTVAGSDGHCANLNLSGVGSVGPEKNRKLAPKLSEFIHKQLHIPKDRFHVNIFDIPKSFCVWNGQIFD
ncbi:hypothetical protein EGW08_009328 [Elysia chlorotica]|uniref:L-dopachrome isomerase n=1 Tax=Elysia chlorotica TaxID=188477 RepID=A0A3S1C4Q2_ELYCH|nr:hypothetical protein EGW08_009328 [Elysia chlorotica]